VSWCQAAYLPYVVGVCGSGSSCSSKEGSQAKNSDGRLEVSIERNQCK
jgi:hypothetical protein